MKRIFSLLQLLFAVIFFVSWASDVGAQGRQSLVAEGAILKKLASGFRFTEGPALSPQGDVFFSDVPANRIYKWSHKTGMVTLVRENTGAANGLFFDGNGNLLACEGNARRITSMTPEGEVSVIVNGYYEGKNFNRPNDLWLGPKGGIYFTDPGYGRSKGELDLDFDGVYYINPDRKSLILVSDDLNRPNGIIGKAEGDVLYVTELQRGRTWSYQIQANGTLSGKTLFVPAGSDGMTMDSLKNVYLTNQEKNSVDIYSPDGQLLESILLPEMPSNVTFGGLGNRTLFITASSSFYSIDMRVAGQYN